MGEYLSKFTGLEIDTRLDKTDSIDTLFAGLNTLNDVKADKTAIPDVSGFATKQELDSGLEPKADKAEIPDVSGLATQAQVQEVKIGLETQINGKQPVGEYALESDIPTIPTTLPNPNAITINGTSYDGTEAVSMTIEGGGGGGGIPDAPADSKTYGRKNNLWDEVVIPPAYNDTQVRGLITANAESISGLETSKADKTAIPDVSFFATKQEVTQGLSEKQPTGDYATNAALTQGLATKQPTGEYALKSDIPTVPTTLPNPNALTINGTPYDGSEAVTLNIESGGGEGAALATDAEWNTGTTTAKAPNVAQVKLSLNAIAPLEAFTYPATRFTIVDGSKDEMLQNNTMTIDETNSNILRSAPCSAITSNSNIVQIGELSLDASTLNNGVYYIYFDNSDNSLKTTRVFLQSGGKPSDFNIYNTHTLEATDFNSTLGSAVTSYYPSLIDGNYATWFPFDDVARAGAFLEVLIPETLYGVSLVSITYALENNGNRNPASKNMRTEAVYTDGSKVTVQDLACAPNQRATVDLSRVDVAGLKSIRFTRTNKSPTGYPTTMTQIRSFIHAPIGIIDDELPIEDIIQLDNRWLNFNVKKYDAVVQGTSIVDIVMLGYMSVTDGVITNVHNYAFGETHYDYDLYSLEGSTPRQLFDTFVSSITQKLSTLSVTIDGTEYPVVNSTATLPNGSA